MERYREMRDWIESVKEIRPLELESVINVEKGEGLESVENIIYLCPSGKYVIW